VVEHFCLKFLSIRLFALIGLPQIQLDFVSVKLESLSARIGSQLFVSTYSFIPTAIQPCCICLLIAILLSSGSHPPKIVGVLILESILWVLFDRLLVPHRLHADYIVPLFLTIVNVLILQPSKGRRAKCRQLGGSSTSFELLSELWR